MIQYSDRPFHQAGINNYSDQAGDQAYLSICALVILLVCDDDYEGQYFSMPLFDPVNFSSYQDTR